MEGTILLLALLAGYTVDTVRVIRGFGVRNCSGAGWLWEGGADSCCRCVRLSGVHSVGSSILSLRLGMIRHS